MCYHSSSSQKALRRFWVSNILSNTWRSTRNAQKKKLPCLEISFLFNHGLPDHQANQQSIVQTRHPDWNTSLALKSPVTCPSACWLYGFPNKNVHGWKKENSGCSSYVSGKPSVIYNAVGQSTRLHKQMGSEPAEHLEKPSRRTLIAVLHSCKPLDYEQPVSLPLLLGYNVFHSRLFSQTTQLHPLFLQAHFEEKLGAQCISLSQSMHLLASACTIIITHTCMLAFLLLACFLLLGIAEEVQIPFKHLWPFGNTNFWL